MRLSTVSKVSIGSGNRNKEMSNAVVELAHTPHFPSVKTLDPRFAVPAPIVRSDPLISLEVCESDAGTGGGD